jgi:hypothetical protein
MRRSVVLFGIAFVLLLGFPFSSFAQCRDDFYATHLDCTLRRATDRTNDRATYRFDTGKEVYEKTGNTRKFLWWDYAEIRTVVFSERRNPIVFGPDDPITPDMTIYVTQKYEPDMIEVKILDTAQDRTTFWELFPYEYAYGGFFSIISHNSRFEKPEVEVHFTDRKFGARIDLSCRQQYRCEKSCL